MIAFDQNICRDLKEASSREWLETNGIGGFASSTIAGMNTRRYHGLLIAATQPPVGRMVLVSKLEETLIIDGTRYDLSTNTYAGAVHPRGHEYLSAFRLDPWPISTFEIAGVTIEKSIFMPHGSNTTVVRYTLLGAKRGNVRLEVRPLIAFRDYHSTTHENSAINGHAETSEGLLLLRPYDSVPPCFIAHNAENVSQQGDWYKNFLYSVEQERGLDYLEDLFNPVALNFDLSSGTANIILSTEQHDNNRAQSLAEKELTRRRQLTETSPLANDFGRQLISAADQFIVRRGSGHTIIAGYPWFTDWGRDTMISLPGLTISTGRSDIAKAILKTFAEHVDEGMLPNLFRDNGTTAEFNTVDATLWYFEAVRAYAEATGDYDFVRELYPTLSNIIDWHLRGTRYDIHALDNGLLNAGVPGVQLTWMDAKVGDTVITPRIGKPVEIQALWYNALRVMADFAEMFADSARQRRMDDFSSRLRWSFNRLFWNDRESCLYDVVNGGPPDPSIRPNQIFAISLKHSMLSKERARAILANVDEHLLTPYGLRTLSPSDPKYRPRYEGDSASRDSAYHQGTVWPWLLGPYISAHLKTHDYSPAARAHAASLLQPIEDHLSHAGLGQVSEVFDADAPQRPAGCFAQAWSVAELIRAKLEIENTAETRAAIAS